MLVKKSLYCALLVSAAFFVQPGLKFSEAHAQVTGHESLSVDLKTAVANGVRTNPEYGVVSASRRATDEELRQGRSLYLPSLDLSSDAGFEHTNDPGTRAVGDDTEDLFLTQSTLTLTQMLFDGFSSLYEVRRQKARVTSSAHRVHETIELVGLSIIEAYLDVLRQRYLLSISNENVGDHLDILKQIQDGVNAGRSTQADLAQAKARLSSARATQANVLESLKNSESQYLREVGDKPGELMMPVVPYDSLTSDLGDQVVHILANSPTLKIFESDIEVAYAEAEGTKSAYYPQVDFQLQGNYADDIGGVESYDKSASALMTMNWNLYRGGGDVARAREFEHRHQQAKESRAQAARALEDEVRQTWSSMVSSGARAKEFYDQANANIEVVSAYRDQFDLNRRTLLDVLDAQNELFVSQTNKVNSEFVQMFAVYRLLALGGDLFSVFGINAPQETYVTADHVWDDELRAKAR